MSDAIELLTIVYSTPEDFFCFFVRELRVTICYCFVTIDRAGTFVIVLLVRTSELEQKASTARKKGFRSLFRTNIQLPASGSYEIKNWAPTIYRVELAESQVPFLPIGRQ